MASYLERQIKDPRLGMVTITDVRMTGDLHDATIFYTVYGDDTERADSAAALEAARGQMRTEVGRQTGVKFTPTLEFILDELPDRPSTSTSCWQSPARPMLRCRRSAKMRGRRAIPIRTVSRVTSSKTTEHDRSDTGRRMWLSATWTS